MKYLFLLLLLPINSRADTDVSIYDSAVKGKVVVRVTYDGCVTDFLANLRELLNPKALDAIADKAIERSQNGCK